ncbi:hypothetical protein BDW22DRAFT_1334255 [Trametopsis cervina]|nr:hypothetical protein BDW22DRAFT_1334255 [Trametopsis cervina]
MADSSVDTDDHGSQSPSDAVQPSMTMHPISYPSMPMHMYPFPPGMMPAQPPRTKRRQVKNACTNCQKACKKCDDARPCLRCVKYGIAEECVDSQRKERQKGIKRGPYKKRDGKGMHYFHSSSANVDSQLDVSAQQTIQMPTAAMASTSAGPPGIPYMHPLGYPPFFGQYPTMTGKPGEAPTYAYPQYYLTPIPMPPHQATGQDGEALAYPPPNLIPATFVTSYAQQPYPGAALPYMVPMPAPGQRPDGQQQIPLVAAPPMQYAYPPYAKPPSRENGNDIPPPPPPPQQMMDPNRRDPRMDPYGARMPDGISAVHGKTG